MLTSTGDDKRNVIPRGTLVVKINARKKGTAQCRLTKFLDAGFPCGLQQFFVERGQRDIES